MTRACWLIDAQDPAVPERLERAPLSAVGAGATHAGKQRGRNEDCFLVDNELGLYLICDGMGGHAAGEVAAATAIETVASLLHQQQAEIERARGCEGGAQELRVMVEQAVQDACRVVHDLSRSRLDYLGMGCTLTLLLVSGPRAIMAHVGDTRLYLIREGQVRQLSTDHTMAGELARLGAISADQVKEHPYGHIITRAIGVQPSVEVDTLAVDVLPGDRYLLCSDGLSDYVEDLPWLGGLAEDPDLESIPETLIDFANASGGGDNITVVAVGIEAGQR